MFEATLPSGPRKLSGPGTGKLPVLPNSNHMDSDKPESALQSNRGTKEERHTEIFLRIAILPSLA